MKDPVKITLPKTEPVQEHWTVARCRLDQERILESETSLMQLKAEIAAAGDSFPPLADKDEMFANIELAYRHLEDAWMRIGKVIQAFDGRKEIYK